MKRPLLGGPAACWIAFCGLLAMLSLAARAVSPEAIDWQPVRAWSEPWRWWTAGFVHYSALHLAANLAGCAVVGAFGWTARLPLRWLAAWLVAWPLVHLTLLVEPALVHYGGLSGLLHAGVAIGAAGLVWNERGQRRAIGAAVLVGLVLKVIAERPWVGPVQQLPEWDIGVAPIAHATGVVVGLVCAAVAGTTAGGRRLRDSAA